MTPATRSRPLDRRVTYNARYAPWAISLMFVFEVLFTNALWIIGLATILAAFSYADWLAHERGRPSRRVLLSSTFWGPFSVGVVLVCLGLVLSSREWWERAVWAALALLFAWQGWTIKRSRRDREES